jgi:glutamate-5-semialdehyde dehydrogenase
MENASIDSDLATVVSQATEASQHLATASPQQRDRAILTMGTALKNAFQDILEANTLDLEASRELRISELLLEWLKLTPERLNRTIDLLNRLGGLSLGNDPMAAIQYANGSHSYGQIKPLGTIALIYEALPELGAIGAAMGWKTGNSTILRGGIEAQHTNQAIVTALQQGLEQADLPPSSIQIISPTPSALYALLTQNQQIKLAIPYGRPILIEQVTQQATVPILPAAIGNCYLYWGMGGDVDLVRHLICDSHVGEPDAVNAIEKVLIHPDPKPTALTTLWKSLAEKGFRLRGDRELVNSYGEYLQLADEREWSYPYLRKVVAFKLVQDVNDAIVQIDRGSSGHADGIVTDSYTESQRFVAGVNSACIYVNASPRFYRYQRGSDRMYLGMSNRRRRQGGGIGFDSFVARQQVIMG